MHHRESLKKQKIKVTPSRLAILAVLEAARAPLTVQNIAKLVGRVADQATVYRTLQTLKKARLIRQIDFQHGHAHFEMLPEKDHHHIVCVKCQKIEDIHNCTVGTMAKTIIGSTNFATIEDHSLEFFGICRDCAI